MMQPVNDGDDAPVPIVLGSKWHPLTVTLIALTNGLHRNQFWAMNTHLQTRTAAPGSSPYAQLLVEDDGSVLAEIGNLGGGDREATAELSDLLTLGWQEPPSNSPNASRRYPAGANAATIAEHIVRALIVVFGLTVDDLVSFAGKSDDVRLLRTLEPETDRLFRLEPFEEADLEERPELEQDGDFATAVEIMARLLESGVIDAPGEPTMPDRLGGPVELQGVSYQHSGFSDNDIVGWVIDVSSWHDGQEVDWIDHIEQLGGEDPLVLMTGVNWALTIRAGQPDSDVPDGLAYRLRHALPGGFVQWSEGQDASWFDPQFERASEVLQALEFEGFVWQIITPPSDLDPYLDECLEDDTFAEFHIVGKDGRWAAGCILIDKNWAANAADALDGYLQRSPDSVTIAGDGWVLRIARTASDLTADECAERLARVLGASYADSELVEIDEPAPAIDTSRWGPRLEQIKQMLLWASAHYLAVPQERWTEERRDAWLRIAGLAETGDRAQGIEQAARLMRRIATNDFFKHTGVEALTALAARDLISREDYDLFTVPWRAIIGRIHPDDPDVVRDSRGGPVRPARTKFG